MDTEATPATEDTEDTSVSAVAIKCGPADSTPSKAQIRETRGSNLLVHTLPRTRENFVCRTCPTPITYPVWLRISVHQEKAKTDAK